MFWSVAFAQASAQSTQTSQQPSTVEMFMPFVFILAIFYFLIIRPQSKRQKEMRAFLKEIKRGDEVITTGGILGTIDGITDQFVTLEIANNVKIKMLRSQVASSQKSVTQKPQEGKK